MCDGWVSVLGFHISFKADAWKGGLQFMQLSFIIHVSQAAEKSHFGKDQLP